MISIMCDLYPGPAETEFSHTPAPTYPEPAPPEVVRELPPPETEHQYEAI